MNKLGTAMGGLLLIGALAAPVAFAHYDTGAAPLAGAPFADHTPYTTGMTPNGNRVAGWYYGSTNTYLGHTSTINQPIPGNPGSNCGLMPTPQTVAACQALTSPINPGFLFAQWSGLADAEVAGPGSCGFPADESMVDGGAGGQAPDGTFNDGGHGFVTHTDHYDCLSYNTLGCDYAPAYGEDLLVGANVWLATQCNWGIVVSNGAPGLDDIANDFLGQAINCPLGGFPVSCVEAADYLGDCLIGPAPSIDSTVDRCQGNVTGVVCGNGSVTTTNFGTPGTFPGGGGVAFPAAGVSNPGGVNCDNQATASVFPFTAVIACSTSGGPCGTPYVSTATVGWIG